MRKILLFLFVGLVITLITGIATFTYSRSWENALFINPIYEIATDKKVVALTFDDGPSLTRTPGLLNLLNQHNVKATFFMLGENIERHPDIAHAVYIQGHLIGNHSYNHPHLIFKSPSFVMEQIKKTDLLIESLGQKETIYFRPPYTSKYIILPLILLSLNKKLVTGTYDPPSEYSSPYIAKNVANEVLQNTEPGSIIYLHDGKDSDQDQFIESVELIIIGLKEKGYKFIRLDYKESSTYDLFISILAFIPNYVLSLLTIKNKKKDYEMITTIPLMTINEIKTAASNILTKYQFKRHIFWRYSIIYKLEEK